MANHDTQLNENLIESLGPAEDLPPSEEPASPQGQVSVSTADDGPGARGSSQILDDEIAHIFSDALDPKVLPSPGHYHADRSVAGGGSPSSPTVLPLFTGSRDAQDSSQAKSQRQQGNPVKVVLGPDRPAPFKELSSSKSSDDSDELMSTSVHLQGTTRSAENYHGSKSIFHQLGNETVGLSPGDNICLVSDQTDAPRLDLHLFNAQAATAGQVHSIGHPGRQSIGFQASPYLAHFDHFYLNQPSMPTYIVKDIVMAFRFNETLQSVRAGHRNTIIIDLRDQIATLTRELRTEQLKVKMIQSDNNRLRDGLHTVVGNEASSLITHGLNLSADTPISGHKEIYRTTIERLQANSAEIELLMAGLHIKSGMLTFAVKDAEKAQKHFQALEGYKGSEAKALFWQGISWYHIANYEQARLAFVESTALGLGVTGDKSDAGMCVELWIQKCDKKLGNYAVDVARNF